ncbi:hypothetical protein MHBO_004572 [Bonamia ostreae]|uniref:Uncharacterized protein n=1 Tax=Bonamia ostreae TaxID=126728 RepID=A0ABV2ATN8_9EUKA
MRSLLNDREIKILDDAIEQSVAMADYNRFRKNNSNTQNLRDVREGLRGKKFVDQINQLINSDEFVTAISVAKNIGKFSKKMKVPIFSKFAMMLNSVLKGLGVSSEYFIEKNNAKTMARIIHLLIDDISKGYIIDRSARKVRSIPSFKEFWKPIGTNN